MNGTMLISEREVCVDLREGISDLPCRAMGLMVPSSGEGVLRPYGEFVIAEIALQWRS
jgi:hypothetical protein